MIDLQEREAITRPEHRHFRCLDLDRWDEVDTCGLGGAPSADPGGERPT